MGETGLTTTTSGATSSTRPTLGDMGSTKTSLEVTGVTVATVETGTVKEDDDEEEEEEDEEGEGEGEGEEEEEGDLEEGDLASFLTGILETKTLDLVLKAARRSATLFFLLREGSFLTRAGVDERCSFLVAVLMASDLATKGTLEERTVSAFLGAAVGRRELMRDILTNGSQRGRVWQLVAEIWFVSGLG